MVGVVRDRAWCVEHDRSAEFVTTSQHRVCFSGLGNAETTCRIESEAGSVEIHVDCEGCAENTAIVRALVAADERLAQIAELLDEIDRGGRDLERLLEATRLARGEGPA